MAIGIYFAPKGMTTQKYGEVLKLLEAAGAGAPKGRLYHSCFGDPNELHVYDVWASQAEFDAFGAVLLPILAKHDIEIGQPAVMPIHNTIVG